MLIFHQWAEQPVGIERFLRNSKNKVMTLSDEDAITFFPSEHRSSIRSHGTEYEDKEYRFLGTPNCRPRTVRALIHYVH